MSIDGCYSLPVRMFLKLYFQKQSIWKKNLTLIFFSKNIITCLGLGLRTESDLQLFIGIFSR